MQKIRMYEYEDSIHNRCGGINIFKIILEALEGILDTT